MTLKRLKFIGIFIIFIICCINHFIYELSPNLITSIFFPVNESIFEHMKLISTSYFIYSIIEYIIIKKNNIDINNYIFGIFITPVIGIILYLLIYLPLYNMFGESMLLSIGLLFIIIIIEQIVNYFIITFKKIDFLKIVGYIGLIIINITFAYLTYNPPLTDLFLDKTEEKYGLDILK